MDSSRRNVSGRGPARGGEQIQKTTEMQAHPSLTIVGVCTFSGKKKKILKKKKKKTYLTNIKISSLSPYFFLFHYLLKKL